MFGEYSPVKARTCALSSVLLLRKFRELALFILDKTEDSSHMTTKKESWMIRCVKRRLDSWGSSAGWAGAAAVPGVARLLRAAALQLLHQHLAAPSQSIADLPEGAAAPQGAVPVLGGREQNT